MSRKALAALALAACACGGAEQKTLPPFGQILLYVDTDAPLPAPAGEKLGLTDPIPLFDRVRIEVFRPGETTPCADCRHEFDLDRRLVGEGRASVGIRPPPRTSGYVARVRLFRAIQVEAGEPRIDGALDTTVALPPVEPEGITPVTVVLRTEDLARPIGTRAEPVAPQLGAPAGGLAGTWAPAKRRDCGAAPRPNEVCIPGGAYWKGHTLRGDAPEDPATVRIAAVSPFFLDRTEVTVAAFREAGIAQKNDPFPFLNETQDVKISCTYTDQVGNNESMPVNCLSWDMARAYCQSQGADLPTEAQFEYVAGGLANKTYVWGDDIPSCGDAVFARWQNISRLYSCPGSSPEPAGSGARDRLVLPGGTVYDINGNVAEYIRDLYNLRSERCWGLGVFLDPVCDEDHATLREGRPHTLMGGTWVDIAGSLAATSRGPTLPFSNMKSTNPNVLAAFLGVGFRCAREGR